MKKRKIASALTKKGFHSEERSDHTFFILYVNGTKTPIYTKLGRGSKGLKKSLISAIRKQLKFRDMEGLQGFVDCPITEEEYVAMLRRNGEI